LVEIPNLPSNLGFSLFSLFKQENPSHMQTS